MAHILTETEAAVVLRCETDDPNLLELLPLVDSYIQSATGRDWAADNPIHPTAKSAARILLVRWHEDPGGLGTQLGPAQQAVLAQLEALALRYVTFAGRNGAGPITLEKAHIGDTVASLVGRVGVSGDQSAAFENLISIEGQIQQLSGADLSLNWYTAYLVPPEAT